jgi:hypothetical protein
MLNIKLDLQYPHEIVGYIESYSGTHFVAVFKCAHDHRGPRYDIYSVEAKGRRPDAEHRVGRRCFFQCHAETHPEALRKLIALYDR